MITNNLYNSILINPKLTSRANKIFIVSGYASATFARRHLLDLLKINGNIEVNLIIGMPGRKSDHVAFIQMHNEFPKNFKGFYLNATPPVHSKIYSWFNKQMPIKGFAGSANYSQYGFFEDQQLNQMSSENPTLIKSFYNKLLKRSVYMPDHRIVIPVGHGLTGVIGSIPAGQIFWEIPDRRVKISFLSKNGNLPSISGLNWGQRREKRINKRTGAISYVTREPNQAYLSLKSSARKISFLPEHAFTFTLVTDDGTSFDCVVAQQGRKAIETTNDNSLLGKYVRDRLGIPHGAPVLIEDLERYGRTDYTLEKLNDETFLFDFSART